MASVTRTGIKSYHCMPLVMCNGVISPAFQNQFNESLQCLANTGETVADLQGGVVHGEPAPVMGWNRGKNFVGTEYNLVHPVEISPMHNKYMLTMRGKLGNTSGKSMTWISARLMHPGQSLGSVGFIGELISGSPSVPAVQVQAAYNTQTDIIIIGDINPNLIPGSVINPTAAGSAFKLNFWINIALTGGGNFNITGNEWYGLMNCKLKFFKQCP